jgi:hypothetical protein
MEIHIFDGNPGAPTTNDNLARRANWFMDCKQPLIESAQSFRYRLPGCDFRVRADDVRERERERGVCTAEKALTICIKPPSPICLAK